MLSINDSEYIMAARAIGSLPWLIIVSLIFPNTIAQVIVFATLGTYGRIGNL